MNSTIKYALLSLTLLLLVTLASAQASAPLPSADAVVVKMMQFDAQRQSDLTGYAATRRYVAVNKTRRAEMVVHVECASDGAKQFTILSEEGSGSIRKHVFQKLLNEESEASRRGTRKGTRLIPANYDFQIVGQETGVGDLLDHQFFSFPASPRFRTPRRCRSWARLRCRAPRSGSRPEAGQRDPAAGTPAPPNRPGSI